MTDKPSIYLIRAVLALIVVIGALSAAEVVSMWAIWGHPRAAEWTGALGTVGALVMTIWLATAESRRSNRRDLALARLTAFRVFPSIVTINTNMLQARAALHYTMESDLREFSFSFANEALGVEDSLTQEDLIGMVPLPDGISLILADGLGARAAAKSMLSMAISNPRLKTDHEYRYEVAHVVTHLLDESIARFDKITPLLQRIVKTESLYRE